MFFIRFSLHALALLILSACSAGQTAPPTRPNILLILVDDMGWSDLGCYGGEVQTPNIDRLAREGTRFTQFYNNAKCTTTRASLLTGIYPRRDQGDKFLLRENMLTLGEAMKLAGYQTALSGKWHLGRDSVRHPAHRGFDNYYGLLDGCSNFFNPAQQDPPYKGNRIRYFADQHQRITEFPEDYYTTDAFTDRAIDFLDDFAQSEAPFFLHLCYTAPHYPLHAWPEDIEKYKGKFSMGWQQMRKQRYQRQLEMGLIDSVRYPLSATDSRSYPWDESQQEFEDLRMAVYAAMLDRVDQQIGRLRTKLEKLGMLDNTLILFLSDNGGCAEEPGGRDPAERNPGPGDDYVALGPAWGWAQNAPFRRYKVWMHEGGTNTPFIAWWPGRIPAGQINQESVGHIIDLMPTLIELGGGFYPEHNNGKALIPCEGKSFWPVLQGGSRPGHEKLFWEYTGNRALRQGDWKIVWDKLEKEWALYDMSQDRTETRNLAAQYPDKVTNMVADWMQWAEQTGTPIQ